MEEDGAEDVLGDGLLPDDSAASACGALGAEALLVLALAGLLRNRRATG